MRDFLLGVGCLCSLIGIASVIKPLQLLRIRTRRMGALVLLTGMVLNIVGVSTSVGGFLVGVGSLCFLVGMVSLIKPLEFVGIRTRRMAALVLLADIVIVMVGGGILGGKPAPSTPPSQTLTATPGEAGSSASTAQAAVSTVPPSITATSLPAGGVGGLYKASLSVTGGTPPYNWSLARGRLPPGLILSGDGTISGAPTAAGTYNFTVQVQDSHHPAQTAQQPLSIAIDEVCPAKTPVLVGKWVVAAGIDPGVQLKDRLGNEFLSIKADEGYTFALVPVAVTNASNQTESLTLVIWELSDSAGRVYKIETLADMYLPEKARLDATGVPPEATRTGYLVFQVKKGAEGLVLSMESMLREVKWKIK
ncbi:MAG: putative Ig domain-containing protein [Bacillota bacterium]|nr:putative Ig domain-containing protein [Bacillota bacterium]